MNLTLKSYPKVFKSKITPILSEIIFTGPWTTMISFLVPRRKEIMLAGVGVSTEIKWSLQL